MMLVLYAKTHIRTINGQNIVIKKPLNPRLTELNGFKSLHP